LHLIGYFHNNFMKYAYLLVTVIAVRAAGNMG
jgi:hypothetical protein